jgi:hypothetical protein
MAIYYNNFDGLLKLGYGKKIYLPGLRNFRGDIKTRVYLKMNRVYGNLYMYFKGHKCQRV